MALKTKIPCPKCDAKGVIPQYFYNRKGICFMCWGARYIMVKVPAGKDQETYVKELRDKNKPDFKKNPPKVAMPHKDEIKNPSYFPASNSKVTPKAEVKKEEPTKKEPKLKGVNTKGLHLDYDKYEGMEAADIYTAVRKDYKDLDAKQLNELLENTFSDQEAEEYEVYRIAVAAARGLDALLREKEGLTESYKQGIRDKIRKSFGDEDDIEYLEYLINDREKSANNSSYSKSLRETKAIEVDELKKILAEKLAAKEDSVTGDDAIRAAAMEQIKGFSVEQLQTALKTVKNKLENNPNPDRVSVVTGEAIRDKLIELTEGPKPVQGFSKLPDSGEFNKEFTRKMDWNRFYESHYEERKGNKAALIELAEHIKRFGPVDFRLTYLNVAESDLAGLEMKEWGEFKREAGIDKRDAKAKAWRKALNLLDSVLYKDNATIQAASTRHEIERRVASLEKEEEYDNFMDKHFPKDGQFRAYDLFSKEQAEAALKELDTIKDEENRKKAKEYAEGVLDYRKRNAVRDTMVAKVDALNEERKEKRKEITENIKFKDTELGRKVKAMAAKGVNSTEDAEAIGKVVAERFEQNIEEMSGIDYKEMATKYKKYRDVVTKYDALEDEIRILGNRSRDARVSEDNRFGYAEKKNKLIPERDALYKQMEESRFEVAKYDAKIKAIKPQAYVKTMSEIRDMGGSMNFTEDSQKASPEVYRRFQEETAGKFPKEWIEASNVLPMQLAPVPKDGRGYHRDEKDSYISRDSGEMVITTPIGELALDAAKNKWSGRECVYHHELQHRMDSIHPKVNKLMREMYVKKVTNPKGKAKKAKWLGGNYKKLEVGRDTADGKGPWMSKYMGKHYGSKFNTDNPADTDGWEVGTVASEMIIFDQLQMNGRRIEFFQEDIYHFMLGVYASV